MSVLDKEVLTERIGDDRVGLLAFRAYMAILAASHVTRSDGTLRFDVDTIRWSLLTGLPSVTPEDVQGVRERLEALGLVVTYAPDPNRHAFVPRWWSYNTRPDKARRATRTPEIPEDKLKDFPAFARIYREIPVASERSLTRVRRVTGSAVPGKGGKGRAPEPEPDPEPDPAPGPALGTVLEAAHGGAEIGGDPVGPDSWRVPQSETDAIALFASIRRMRFTEPWEATPGDTLAFRPYWKSVDDRSELPERFSTFLHTRLRPGDATLAAFVGWTKVPHA